DGSSPRFASAFHRIENNGARTTMKKALKNCVWPAEIDQLPNTVRSVLRSANRVSDDPACSNRVQKTTLKTIRTIAAHIIWNSTRVPRKYDQARMAGTPSRKVPNSSLPM